jgi:hypothetical protein
VAALLHRNSQYRGGLMMILDASAHTSRKYATIHCAEWERLFGVFTAAIGEMIAVQAAQFHAHGDQLMRLAERKKRNAKRALMVHLAVHRDCGN